MTDGTVNSYVELALDLPERKRNELLRRLDAEEPDLARAVREMLEDAVANRAFACRTQDSANRGEKRAADGQLDALHHVALQVRDVAKAVAWYRDCFACEVEYEDSSWALLRFANMNVALVLPEQHPPHLALVRPDAETFGELTRHRDGSRSIYTIDPWGNSIEIIDSYSLPAANKPGRS